MYTIRNSNNGQQTTCNDMAQVKRILKSIAKLHGKAALEGIYVDKVGERDPYYAVDLVK